MQRRIIAMWSGPRNISTAMMRSWGSRRDTVVMDEPFYAHYLQQTDCDHPGAKEVIAAYETDWQTVVHQMLADGDSPIVYQKHMTHHMLKHIDRAWMRQVSNCFLIRDPRRMILSYAKVIPNPTSEQMGLAQQAEIFEYVRQTAGEIPPVIEARDVLLHPAKTLRRLCQALDVPFDEAMLHWPAGRRSTDGLWGKYWYANVEKSTGFQPYHEDSTRLPKRLRPLLEECQFYYNKLARHRLHWDTV